MPWSLAILGFFVYIDAEHDPWLALAMAALAAGALWFIVASARRREERKAEEQRSPDPRPRSW
jgi:hypothetical protein